MARIKQDNKPLMLSDLKLTYAQKSFAASLINVKGTGQHPVCTVDNLGDFYVSYLQQIVNNPKSTKGMAEKGLEIFNEIKNILDNL